MTSVQAKHPAEDGVEAAEEGAAQAGDGAAQEAAAAQAGGGQAGVSSDGTTWDRIVDIAAPDTQHVVYGNGTFVVGGRQGWLMASSDNGTTWAGSRITTNGINSIVFSDGGFIASDTSSIFRSEDGLEWTRVNGSAGVTPRAGVGRTLFGTGNGAFYRSTDGGFSWEQRYTFTNGSNFNDAVFAGGS